MDHLHLGPLHTSCPQVSPGSVHLLRVVEDFIHLVGDALKAFQSSLIVTDNLGTGGRWGGCWLWSPGPRGGGMVSEAAPVPLSWGPVFSIVHSYLYFSLHVPSLPSSLCCVSLCVGLCTSGLVPILVSASAFLVCVPHMSLSFVSVLHVSVCLCCPPPRPPAVISIQREPVSAVSSDITFPMRGRRGMKDWVRHSEDRLFLPKEVLSLSSPGKPAASAASSSPARGRGPGTVPPGPGYSHQRLLPADPEDSSSYFVIGAVLYRTLGLILPPPR